MGVCKSNNVKESYPNTENTLKVLNDNGFQGISGKLKKTDIVRVIDGDTFIIDFDLNVEDLKNSMVFDNSPKTVKIRLRCRLAGANAYEINTEKGIQAKKFVINFFKSSNLKYLLLGKCKYGRILIEIYKNKSSLSDYLKANELAE